MQVDLIKLLLAAKLLGGHELKVDAAHSRGQPKVDSNENLLAFSLHGEQF